MSNPPTIDDAFDHLEAGRVAQATAVCEHLISQDQSHVEALHLLAMLRRDAGNHAQAIGLLERVTALQPQNVEAFTDLAGVCLEAGRDQQAEKGLIAALALRPADANILVALGKVQRKLGRLDAALSAFQSALERTTPLSNSQMGLIWDEIGVLHALKRQLPNSIAAFQNALRLDPANALAHYHLGKAFAQGGDVDAALPLLEQAIRMAPANVAAKVELGLLLKDNFSLSKAESVFQEAVAIRPDYAEAHCGMGDVYRLLGQADRAVEHLRRAIQLRPDYSDVHSNYLLAQHYRRGNDVAGLFREHQEWARLHAEKLTPRSTAHSNRPDPVRQLRVGYVSGDFWAHPVAAFLQGPLENHNKMEFQTYCYSVGLRQDAVTARLRQAASHWRPVPLIDDESLDKLIRQDGIDILVDLSGHTAHNRLLTFARCPAPVQITWLGYPNTTGMSAMGYRISDIMADPIGLTDAFNTERLIRLPSAWCYMPPEDAPQVKPLPSTQNQGFITFGSLNNLAKISPETIDLWIKILQTVPNSRLLIKAASLKDEAVRSRLVAQFANRGIATGRLDIRGPNMTASEHMNTYNAVDIALDTFPYHGTTTTCEALYMGVPVVTLAGTGHVSRVGASLLSGVGLSHLVASTTDGYVAAASQLAQDISSLAQLRQSLRERMRGSPLMKYQDFTRSLESHYRQVWQAWCARL